MEGEGVVGREGKRAIGAEREGDVKGEVCSFRASLGVVISWSFSYR